MKEIIVDGERERDTSGRKNGEMEKGRKEGGMIEEGRTKKEGMRGGGQKM